MSEETTRDLADNRPFEERVFARFDTMDARFNLVESRFEARFDAIDLRFGSLEARFDARFDGLDARVQALEARALDTKPIWELALAEIVEVKESIYDIKRKFEIVIEDLIQVRSDQRRVDKRMDAIESRPQ